MLDFLHKDFVEQYTFNNITSPEIEKRVLVNGREHVFSGYRPYAVATAIIWHVPVPGVKQFKYVVTIGVAQRKQLYSPIYYGEIDDISVERAWSEPCAKLVFDDLPDHIEHVLYRFTKRLLTTLTTDKMSANEDETVMWLLKKYKDAYSQKYPFDYIYFGDIQSYV